MSMYSTPTPSFMFGGPEDPARAWRATPGSDAIREARAVLDRERRLACAEGDDELAARLAMVMDLLNETLA
jgi:hypothetical protein